MEGVKKKCRLCSAERAGIVELFSNEDNSTETTYALQVQENFQLALADTPDWPRKCCPLCVKFMEDIKKFKNRIIQTHCALVKIFEEDLKKRVTTQREPTPEPPADGNLFESVFIIDHGTSMTIGKPNSSPERILIDEEKAAVDSMEICDVVDSSPTMVSNKASDEDDSAKDLSELTQDDDADLIQEENDSTSNQNKDFQEISSDEEDGEDTEEHDSDEYQDDSEESDSDEAQDESESENGVEVKSGKSTKKHTGNTLTAEELELEKLLQKLDIIKCHLCPFTSRKYFLLREHLTVEHQSAKLCISCCDSKHRFRTGLFDHMRYHLNEAAFKCSVCSKCYKSSRTLRDHKLREHEGRKIVCRLKIRLTEEEEKLQDLMREMDLLKCHLCSHRETEYKALSDHYKLQHEGHIRLNQFAPLRCCNQVYRTRIAGYDHMRIHKNPDAFKCIPCDKRHNNSTTLGVHNRMHHSLSDKLEVPVVCETCNRSFVSEFRYQSHIRWHRATYNVKCSYCEKELSCKSALAIHIARLHEKEYSHICHICGRAFADLTYLNTHLESHKERSDRKPRPSRSRGPGSDPSGQRETRRRRKPGEPKPQRGNSNGKIQQCDICQKYYANLRQHKYLEHSVTLRKAQRRICEKCGTSIYTRHFNAHYSRCGVTDVELVNCSLCERKFVDQRRLKIHIFHIHEKTREFACPYCKFKSGSMGHRLRHIQYSHPEELHKYKIPAGEVNSKEYDDDDKVPKIARGSVLEEGENTKRVETEGDQTRC